MHMLYDSDAFAVVHILANAPAEGHSATTEGPQLPRHGLPEVGALAVVLADKALVTAPVAGGHGGALAVHHVEHRRAGFAIDLF